MEKAQTVHERNYWKTMGMLAGRLAPRETENSARLLEENEHPLPSMLNHELR